MQPFSYRNTATLREALELSTQPGAMLIAGGTTLIDLMKINVLTPKQLIDICDVPLRSIEYGQEGLRIGALETMASVADHPDVSTYYPVISQALLKSASAQLRNMATIGGNLMQKTRCGYYRDTSQACNKRNPGSGCPAIQGENRMHAILGTSDACCATHPSDLAVALVALGATIRLQGKKAAREIAIEDFFLLPGTTPDREHAIDTGEMIVEVRVPRIDWATRSLYLKVRDRESYEFALASAAVALLIEGDQVKDARIAVGGVGTKPWNLPAVRAALIGKPLTRETINNVSKLASEGAQPLSGNTFKISLVQRTVARALLTLGGVA
jgi:xanthine dehydrogenase YagS FAD-binding subunit